MFSQLAHSLRRCEGGYVYVYAAMSVVVVLLGTGLAFMRWSTDEATQSAQVSGAMQAYYLGQMGVVENGLTWLKTRQESDLPIAEVIFAGRTVPEIGRYQDISIQPVIGESGGDFWTQNRVYRISAVGVATVPFYHDGIDDHKDIMRKAILYVSVRNFADYMYLSDNEKTVFGDVIKFWHLDTLRGRVHSNDTIAIMENPVFYDIVSTCQRDFWHGPSYNPQFRGPPPVFLAPVVLIPPVATTLREHADHYYAPGSDYQQRLELIGGLGHMYTWHLGEAFDSTLATQEPIPLTNNTCIFTEAQLELEGIAVLGRVTVGSAQDIRLINDVRVGGATSGPPQYRVDSTNTNIIGIVSEGDIKIANTWANGRQNSSGSGFAQGNQNLTSIVITAAVVALGNPDTGEQGSFTFEQQNIGDSGYVCTACGCQPGTPNMHPPTCGTGGNDDRGTIWLFGSVTQQRRGYVHRTCCNSTGYAKQYLYDVRFKRNRPPCFFDAVDSSGHALFDIVQWGANQSADFTADAQHGKAVRFN